MLLIVNHKPSQVNSIQAYKTFTANCCYLQVYLIAVCVDLAKYEPKSCAQDCGKLLYSLNKKPNHTIIFMSTAFFCCCCCSHFARSMQTAVHIDQSVSYYTFSAVAQPISELLSQAHFWHCCSANQQAITLFTHDLHKKKTCCTVVNGA